MTELDFLQILAPVRAPATVRAAALERLRAAIAGEAARTSTARPRRAWAFAATGALLAAVVVVAVLLQASPRAEARLEQLAAAVEVIPADEFPPGAAFYTRSEEVALNLLPGSDLPGLQAPEYALLLPVTREVWLAADGSVRSRVTTGPPTFFDDATARAFAAAGLADRLGVGTTVTDNFAPSPDRLDPADWPTDPAALEAAMAAEARRRGPAEVALSVRLLDLAADLLRATGAQPDLRAAVLRVLARTPGLAVTESPGLLEVTASYDDEIGRRSYTLGFDTAGNLITEIEVAIDGIPRVGVPPGTATYQARYQLTTVLPATSG